MKLNKYLGLRSKESLGLEGLADKDLKVPLSEVAYCTICTPLFPNPSTGEGSLFSLLTINLSIPPKFQGPCLIFKAKEIKTKYIPMKLQHARKQTRHSAYVSSQSNV